MMRDNAIIDLAHNLCRPLPANHTNIANKDPCESVQSVAKNHPVKSMLSNHCVTMPQQGFYRNSKVCVLKLQRGLHRNRTRAPPNADVDRAAAKKASIRNRLDRRFGPTFCSSRLHDDEYAIVRHGR